LISLQVLINIAVVTSLIPVTGMPLPFFSSGGTALLFTMGEMGVLLNISRQADGAEIKQKKNTHL
ncbi:MAG: FtsW/RodA/SpoVE family cell cycle protein, partial [Clostridia bacterium]|nr:FtsW/RodA/SpoVE family cell cycle protein [Clostridia bacterium]